MDATQSITFSIVIPIYKAENTIISLISLIDETQRNLAASNIKLIEVICVCDDPEDESVSILESLCRHHPYIRLIELSKNVGQHLATSVGILASQGEWIFTIDEDLQHQPRYLPYLFKHAIDRRSDVVYAHSSKYLVHNNIFLRDTLKRIAKHSVSLFSDDPIHLFSSYRLIRGEIGRAAALAVDKNYYLDSGILRFTSKHRCSKISFEYRDTRNERSSYNLKALIVHFNRLLFSSRISNKKILIFFTSLFATMGIISINIILYGFSQGVMTSSPGWLSLYIMQCIIIIMLITGFAIFTRLYSSVYQKVNPSPEYLFISRSRDNLLSILLADYFDKADNDKCITSSPE